MDPDLCYVLKQAKELAPSTDLHRERSRRVTRDNSEKTNQGLCKLLALDGIVQSYFFRPSGVVIVRKDRGKCASVAT